MYGTGWFLEYYTDSIGELWSFDFFLLVLSTVVIAGAGNIINDYFDMKADRVNKPERMIIGKHIKRRVAILSHWFLNLVAFSIAVYLSWKFETFWYVFAHFMAINFLWFYSTNLKRGFLLGNVIVAGLTALVPILVGFYFYHLITTQEVSSGMHYQSIHELIGSLVWIIVGLGLFAFILNLAREITKDIEDVEGDKLLKAKTLPIVMGSSTAKYIVALVIAVGAVLMSGVLISFADILVSHLLLGLLSLVFMVAAVITLFAVNTDKGVKLTNNLLKLSMTAGLLIPVYIRLMETL
jgi:4-hydroxybenzoate polyprenyltransferase